MRPIVLLVSLSVVLVACNKGGKRPEMKTDEDKAFYSLGSMMGSRFKDLDLSDNELALINAGMMDSARDVKSDIDPTKHQFKVQEIFNKRTKVKVEGTKKSGEDYIKKFVEKEGGKRTASGLAYKVLKEGQGKKPQEDSNVEVHYHGTLTNGDVFDSSVERGKTVEFPLNRVIKGWTEGLQLIGEGGKIKLVIPSELAYGDHGAPPKIPGGSTLVFDVELLKVAKAGEAAKAPAPAPAKKKK